jgi:hypothetical protein
MRRNARLLTAEWALCWVHEYRHYTKLTPRLAYHRKRLDEFKEHFWKLYRQLLAYRQHPNQQEADDVRGEFERLFGQGSRLPAVGRAESADAGQARPFADGAFSSRNSLAK